MILELNLTTLLDLLGTLAFALSGIRMASKKQIDWFGAYIIGLVTAIGGGTIRDILLDIKPFWMIDAKYFLTTAFALIIAVVFREKIFRWGSTLFLFDTIGLGLFTIVGISKSVEVGLPIWVCIVMGTITGSLGGVIRDILLNDIPLLFQKDIYALACVLGGAVYFICQNYRLPLEVTKLSAALSVIAIRLVAVKYHLHLPLLPPMNLPKEESKE